MSEGVQADLRPIRIRVFEFTKADLARLPREDRRALILGGHALNQLGLWVKFLALTTNYQTEDSLLDSFNAAQAQAIIRVLCGTLVETWKWINSAEVSSITRVQYSNEIPDEAKASYERLGKHFGSGLLTKARDTFAFHFPNANALDQAFETTPVDGDFNWYMGDENTNSLYFGCETVIGHGLYDLASKEVRGRTGMDRLIHETISAANDVNDFVGGLLFAIVSRHLGNRSRSQFEVGGAPGPKFGLPFLIDRVLGE